ncbi:MAG TPA: stage II sporulation protein M [Thermoleophilaceae bacterium]
MNLERFHATRGARWAELEDLVERAGGKPERLGPDGVRRLGRIYRATAADLALARRAFPGDPVVPRLERLTVAARQAVYAERSRRLSPVRFFARDYWRRVRERPRLLLAAALLMIVPGVLGGLWAGEDPGAAIGLVPDDFLPTVESPGGDRGLSGAESGVFSSSVLTNNIQVAFMALAAGIAAGVGTVLVLLQNGLVLGVVFGLTIENGQGVPLVEQVASHGVLELSCIVVAAAAGLRVGEAILRPGRRKRGDALVEEARGAVETVLGTAPWLVVAGVVEGFVSPRGIGWVAAVAIGLALGALFWALVLWRGRPDPHHAAAGEPQVAPHSRARALALR